MEVNPWLYNLAVISMSELTFCAYIVTFRSNHFNQTLGVPDALFSFSFYLQQLK